jgi:hypothetical protein
MKHVVLAIAMGAAMGKCSDEGKASGDTVVYEGRASVQCGSSGMSPETSAMKLTNAGIEVVQSACGVITGVSFPAVCGGPDGKILLHQIRTTNLRDAEVLGFSSAALLHDPAKGRDYERVNCQSGNIIPAE